MVLSDKSKPENQQFATQTSPNAEISKGGYVGETSEPWELTIYPLKSPKRAIVGLRNTLLNYIDTAQNPISKMTGKQGS